MIIEMAVVVLTRQAVTDWTTAAVALVTLGLLWRFKIGEPYVVIAAGALGILLVDIYLYRPDGTASTCW